MLSEMSRDEMQNYLFKHHAPHFNFEKDDEELLNLAIEKGYVTIWFLPNDTTTYSFTNTYRNLMGIN